MAMKAGGTIMISGSAAASFAKPDFKPATTTLERIAATNLFLDHINWDEDGDAIQEIRNVLSIGKKEWATVGLRDCCGNWNEILDIIIHKFDEIEIMFCPRKPVIVTNNLFEVFSSKLYDNDSISRIFLYGLTMEYTDLEQLRNGMIEGKNSIETIIFRTCSFVQSIMPEGNAVSNEDNNQHGILDLAQGLRACPFLTNLTLSECHLTDLQIAELVNEISKSISLEMLNLSKNYCGANGLRALSQLLQSEKTYLSSLDISYQERDSDTNNNVEDKFDIKYLCPGLIRNKSLRVLNLRLNNIDDNGAASLASMVDQNSTLEILSVGGNQIWSSGAIPLASSVQNSKNIKRLSFGHNPIGTRGWNALITAVQSNHNLQITTEKPWLSEAIILDHFSDINMGGRKIIFHQNATEVPLGVWPLILKRALQYDYSHGNYPSTNSRRGVNVVYYLLREGPLLIQGNNNVNGHQCGHNFRNGKRDHSSI